MDVDGDGADGTCVLDVPGVTIARQVIWLAAPVLVEQSLLYLVGLSDTILTGRYLSAEHLAAVTVATYLHWFLGSLLAIVSVGATALVARLIGSNERARAERIAQQAILMSLIVGSLILAAGWEAAPWVIRMLNLRGVSAESAVLYPADPAGDHPPAGLHTLGYRLPPRGRRYPDGNVGHGPGQRDQRGIELVPGPGPGPVSAARIRRDRPGDGDR